MNKTLLKGLMPACLLMGLLLTGCNAQEDSVYGPAVAKLMEHAKALSDAGQPQEAICRLNAAADLAPNVYEVQYNRGTLYSNEHQWPQAIESLNAALKIKPDSPDALYTLGLSYHSLADDYRHVATAPADTKPDQLGVSPEIAKTGKDEALAKAQENYQHSLDTYQQFLKVAGPEDPGRKDMENEVPAVEQALQQLNNPPAQP